jgi:hypothetical protein
MVGGTKTPWLGHVMGRRRRELSSSVLEEKREEEERYERVHGGVGE